MNKVIFTFGWLIIFTISSWAVDTLPFIDETLNYSVKFNGLATAHSSLTCEQSDSNDIQFQWKLKSKKAFRFVFYVDNIYTSRVNTQTWQTLSFTKDIKQKNIKQKVTTLYKRDENIAYTDNDLQWPAPEKSMDILSLLYHLRLQDLNAGDSLNYIIDLESHIWNITGTVADQDNVKTVNLEFSPSMPIVERAWKTDLMTNRISKALTKLTIQFGPAPLNVPNKIKFENDQSTVEMDLDTE